MSYKGTKLGIFRIRKFTRDRKGATAIEFAILALPFFLLIFAVLETAISFTTEQLMSNAVDSLSRKIRTGQITSANTTEAEFKQQFCDQISLIVPTGCPDLYIDVQQYSTFDAVPKKLTFSSPKVLDKSSFGYAPGGTGTINHMRVVYEWPVMTDLMKSRLAGLNNGRMLLYAATTWQNEPF